MAPGLALDSLTSLQAGSVVLDPMSGSGTVVRQASDLGLNGYGFDLDPLAVLMSNVWTTQVDDQDTDAPWKSDDAAWFEAHPTRLHRIRPLIGEEAASFGSISEQPMPPRHELQVLVRQIEPGQRVRSPFGRNLDTPIPDDEAALHALFDVVTNTGGGADISTGEVLRTMAESLNLQSVNVTRDIDLGNATPLKVAKATPVPGVVGLLFAKV